MPLPTYTTEERLKKLKEEYKKLLSNRDGREEGPILTNDYLSQYGRSLTTQSSSNGSNEERNEIPFNKNFSNEKFWHAQSVGPPKLKLKPLLEDLNQRGPIEKRNFMLQRMEELSSSRPVQIMDYVRKQYPVDDDSTANTFFILGDVHKCVRDYLTSNGWIEKYSGQEERAQLIRTLQGLSTNDSRSLGRIMSADPVKFIWVNGFVNWSFIGNGVVVSRIPSSSYYFSKTALASSIRDLFPFFYQRGNVDVQTPRTFELRVPDDMKHFVRQYRTNACISLLKRFVSCMDCNSNIQMFSEDGTIPLDCVDFAVLRTVEMIRYLQHADLDEWHFSVVSDEDWNLFLLRFYDLIHQDAKFQMKHHNISIPKLFHACEKLCAIYEEYFPETKNDGQRNLWIVKPSNGSCGRGVKIFKRLSEIQQYCKPTNSYVIQKYIENPLLIHQTKFDIRQWFLITSVYPLIIWMYDECYLRFCSQQFNLTNVHESVHLCNNSVQFKYKNGNRSSQLPSDNMWDDQTFQIFLSEREEEEVWPKIKNKMQQAIIAACLVSQDKMYHRANSFHLYGADFMITPDYDVWLIEVNTHPSMKYSTSVTSRMCKEVLQDTLKVGLDRRSNPNADTGKFKEIYRQQTHVPNIGVPSSAARVQSRKIRLLSTVYTKEQTLTKAIELPSKNSRKNPEKWLNYTSIATYKRHSKINFKYVVLRQTDLPLDPGDSISQRDIGYAGVLDKINLNESGAAEEEDTEKELNKKEAEIAKVPPKPNKQITLHRKVITNLKNKKTAQNSEGNAEIVSNKSEKNTKTQNVVEAQITNLQNEVPTENEIHPSKTMHSDVVQKVRNIEEITRTNTVQTKKDTNNYENTTKNIVITKKQTNSQNTINSKKKFSSADALNNDKQVNPKKNSVAEKAKTSKEFVKSDRAKKFKSTTSSEKGRAKLKRGDPEKKIDPEGHEINTRDKIKNENDSIVLVVEEAAGKSSKSNKEYTNSKTCIPTRGKARDERAGTVKKKNSPKNNQPKQNTATKRPSNFVEKIVSDELQAESINFISIRKKGKDLLHPADHDIISKKRNKDTIPKKNDSDQSIGKPSIAKSKKSTTKATRNQKSSMKENTNSPLPVGIPRASKRLNKLAASKQNVTTDSARRNNISIGENNEGIWDFLKKQIVKELKIDTSKDMELLKEENDEQATSEGSVRNQLMFMMTDSESTFRAAETDDESSSLSEASDESIERMRSEK